MKMRRLLSALLAVVMLMSVLSVGIVATSAAETDTAEVAADIDVAAAGSTYEDMLANIEADNNYGLSETVNDGTILQAWTWSFANIEANLETIAEQGFTTIQVSPPNEIKKGTNGAKFLQSDGQNGWWMYYQPSGFQINNSTDNALGTKSQFVSMCSKAHELGLKVIVDAVINHMGTKDGDDNNTSTDPMSHVTPKAATYEPEIYNNKLFHNPWKKMEYIESNNTQYNSTYDLTRNCTSGLPDLKTEDSRVQSAIYDYMEELIQAGADGFRFDAAKHIETPDDISSLKSDFWTNTLVKVQKAHPDQEIYAYGEILNTCGINRPYSMYTKLFDVTDSGSYWGIKNAVTGEYSGNPIPYYPSTNFTAANAMLWDESHDTYVDGSTTSLNTTQRGKIWALVAGRSGISSVYLARPSDNTNTNDLYNIKIGEARKTSWSNATTKAINQFHNYFIGQSEYCSNSGGTAWIERGTTGAMIVNLGGTTTKSVSLKANKLAAGTYKDAVTGNTFTVSGGYIKGNVGSTGVAVIYENNEAPKPTDPPETFILGDADGDGEVNDIDVVKIQRYVVDLATLTEKQLLAADVDGDGFVTTIDASFVQRYVAQLTVKYDIGKEKEVKPVQPTTPVVYPTTPIVYPTDPVSNDSFLLTDNFGWGSAYVYAWDADGNALNGQWPGASQAETQTNEYGETQFICHIPEGAVGVILNNGNGEQTEDITDFSYDGYWMDGSKNDLGHYKVIGWNSDGPVDPVDPTPTPDPKGSFLLTDNFGWGSAYVYSWDADGNALNGEWPGASQAETVTNEYGETQFRCYVPDGAVGVILNNGNGAQTEDITDFTYDGYWMDGSRNELGHYLVTGWNYNSDTPYNPDNPDPVITDGETIIFSNNKGFSTVNIYYWSDSQEPVQWPGVPMTYLDTNEFGETRYTFNMPEGMTNYIINDGSQQTVDIPFTGATGVYMTDLDSEGHYNVDFYSISDTPTPVDPTQPDNPDPPVTDGSTIIFSNNKGLSTVNIYYWSDSEQPVEWPGVPMTYLDTNDYGEDRYTFTMPDGMTSYIINDGAQQTVDIPFTGSTGVYMTDKDSEGHYLVDFYEITDEPTPVDPTQPDNPDPPVTDGSTIIFSNNKGLSTVNIYYWSDSEQPVEWPGVPMTYLDTNDYGEDRYTFTMPDGMTSYIINDGTQQTVDIPFTGSTGVYMTDKDSEGHYLVDFYEITDEPTPTPDPTDPTPDPTESEPVVTDGSTIIFSNNKGFSTVNIYYWSDSEQPVEWPGVAMTSIGLNDYGEERFTFEMPAGMTNYIINDGTQQTVDIPFTGSTGVYMTDKDSEGHYMVDFYEITDDPTPTPDPTDPTPDPTTPDTTTVSFLLTDNFGWGTAYVYAWDANGTALCGEWPGSSQAETVTNDYGETQFRCYVPAGAVGVILNNGNGAQTEDITDFGTYEGYWMNGDKNSQGHYLVTGWNS